MSEPDKARDEALAAVDQRAERTEADVAGEPERLRRIERANSDTAEAELANERIQRTIAGIRANDQEWATKGSDADLRKSSWIVNREAMLAELHRLKVLARSLCHTSPEWMDAFETLSRTCSNLDREYYNVTADRPVWHLPEGQLEQDFTETPHNQARQLQREMPAGGVPDG